MIASARLWNVGSPNSIRQGPTRSMMARMIGSDFFRWKMAFRMVTTIFTRAHIRSSLITALISPPSHRDPEKSKFGFFSAPLCLRGGEVVHKGRWRWLRLAVPVSSFVVARLHVGGDGKP